MLRITKLEKIEIRLQTDMEKVASVQALLANIFLKLGTFLDNQQFSCSFHPSMPTILHSHQKLIHFFQRISGIIEHKNIEAEMIRKLRKLKNAQMSKSLEQFSLHPFLRVLLKKEKKSYCRLFSPLVDNKFCVPYRQLCQSSKPYFTMWVTSFLWTRSLQGTGTRTCM